MPTWYLRSAFATYHDYIALAHRFDLDEILDDPSDEGFRLSTTAILDSDNVWTLSDLSSTGRELRATDSDDAGQKGVPSSPAELLASLLPIFVAAFLDAAPTAFAPGTSATASGSAADLPLETVLSVTESARDLWRSSISRTQLDTANAALPAGVLSGLEKLVGYMATYFPFGSDELAKRPMAQELQLQRLNIAYCELVSLLHISQPTKAKTSRLGAQLQTVQAYVEQVLGGSIGTIGGNSLNAQSYIQLLPTIWSLLSSESIAKEAVLQTVIKHTIGLSAASGVKQIATGFLIRLVRVSCRGAASKTWSLTMLFRYRKCRLIEGASRYVF